MSKIKNIFRKQIFSFTYLLRIIMIVSIIIAYWRRDLVWVVGTCIGLFVSVLPSIIKRDAKFTLPWILDFLIALVTILHMGGRLFDYYYTIENYHLITRFFISVLVAFIGLSMIYILDEHWDGLKMDKYAMSFITIIFTMAIGVILEFVKWLNITGTYYVKTNNVLMLNLSLDTFAGLFIAIIGVNLIKSGRFYDMTDDFGRQIDRMVIDRFENGFFKKKN